MYDAGFMVQDLRVQAPGCRLKYCSLINNAQAYSTISMIGTTETCIVL